MRKEGTGGLEGRKYLIYVFENSFQLLWTEEAEGDKRRGRQAIRGLWPCDGGGEHGLELIDPSG